MFCSLIVCCVWMLFATSTATAQSGGAPPRVQIVTELGVIVVEVYPDKAPVTAANFLRYVDAGLYNGGSFHRTVHADNQQTDSVRIAVIQADIDRARRREAFSPIALERTSVTGLRHIDGTISMARSGPDSATASFFICIGDQPELDFGGRRNRDGQGFAAFGEVVEGMDVVRAINRSAADGQTLRPAIALVRVERAGSD